MYLLIVSESFDKIKYYIGDFDNGKFQPIKGSEKGK